MRYGYFLGFVAFVVVLGVWLFAGGAARADVACPETSTPDAPATETPVPPTETMEATPPPPVEDTPTSPPKWTDTPEPTGSATPTAEQPPMAEPTPDPSPTETGGAPGNPGKTPTVIKTLPVTGSGDLPPNVKLGLTGVAGVVLLAVALLARAGRRDAIR